MTPTLVQAASSYASSTAFDPGKMKDISSLPEIRQRVLSVIADGTSDVAELEAAVACDPPLSMRVLRMANSPVYTMGKRICTIREAVLVLGFKAIRNLATAATIAGMFQRAFEHDIYVRRDLWHHCAATGVCCRMIAKRLCSVDMDTAFLCGILHDIGVIVEDQYRHREFVMALDLARDGQTSLSEAERLVLGEDHCQLGASLARRWSLPPLIRQCLRWHHDPAACDEGSRAAVATVSLSVALCRHKYRDKIGETQRMQLCDHTLRTLAIKPKDIQVLYQDLEAEVTASAMLFRLVDA